MATETTFEQRLANLESAVRELQRRLNLSATPPNWLERVIGSFRDEPAFEEVLELGRAIRQADRPPEDAEP